MADYSKMKPEEVREPDPEGRDYHSHSGMCGGYAQANLVIPPKHMQMISGSLRERIQSPVQFWKSWREVLRVSRYWERGELDHQIFPNISFIRMV